MALNKGVIYRQWEFPKLCKVTWLKVTISRKSPRLKSRSPLQLCNAGKPMERVVADFLGALPETKRGNKCI